jgi:glycosyltransferase involved in cell wall biosynthesis
VEGGEVPTWRGYDGRHLGVLPVSAGSPTLTVIVGTYEWPEALACVLGALADQRDTDFDVVVADDGSGPETARVVEEWSRTYGDRLRHAWQADDGFRRARALNLGAAAAPGDLLAFIDGDCIPRRDFVASVRRALLPGWFIAGKRVDLGIELTRRVLETGSPVWRWSTARLLVQAGRDVRRPGLLLPLRDRRRPWHSGQPDFRPPYNAYGFLFAARRSDFEHVDGFDMRFSGWGQEDEDIALRLRRAGIRCGWAGPKSTLLHLFHESRKSETRPNDRLLAATRASGRIEAVEGLRELAAQETANRVTSSRPSSEPEKR